MEAIEANEIVTTATYDVVIGKYIKEGELFARAFGSPMPLSAKHLWEDASRVLPFILASDGLYQVDDDGRHEKLCGPVDIALRGSRSLFAHVSGLIVKFLSAAGDLQLVAIPEPWLQNDGERAIAKLEASGLLVSPDPRLRAALLNFLRNTRPASLL